MLDPNRPIYTLTVAEFTSLLGQRARGSEEGSKKDNSTEPRRRVYGLHGLAELLGCSKVTAQRIKNSGILNPAISQIGRKIIVDADLALELINKSKTQQP